MSAAPSIMQFVDSAVITVKGGDGGNGLVSFRRAKNIARGGPDGGDGGKGGQVFLEGNRKLHSLLDYKYGSMYAAKGGGTGGGANKHGADGSDLVLPVPRGTLVYDAQSTERIGEVIQDGERLTVAYGGKGGYGNRHFKSSVRRAPTRHTQGGAGEVRKLQLELKILADIGLTGLPNAGKSSFLRAVTRARPKVADYPFTTLAPARGVFIDDSIASDEDLVLADIPGIVQGAAQGRGLGIGFLKHIQRASLLFHLVDLTSPHPLADLRIFEQELGAFAKELLTKPRWVVGNKVDLLTPQQLVGRKKELAQCGLPLFMVSARRGDGTRALCHQAVQFLHG